MRVAPLLEAYRDARTAALRALAVDDRSADAQVALGNVLIFAEWDWPGGERCLRRALEINPNHLQGQLIYGRLLDALGRSKEALEMKLRAFECDPLSPLVHVQIALCYWNQRRYDDAIEWANKALALDPKHLLAREFLAGAYLKKDDIPRYLAEMTEHAACAGVAPESLEPLLNAYAAGGRVGAFHRLQQLSGNLNVPAAVRGAVCRNGRRARYGICPARSGHSRPGSYTHGTGGRSAVGQPARRSAIRAMRGANGSARSNRVMAGLTSFGRPRPRATSTR